MLIVRLHWSRCVTLDLRATWRRSLSLGRVRGEVYDLHAIAGPTTYSKGNLTSRWRRNGRLVRIDAIKRNRSNYELMVGERNARNFPILCRLDPTMGKYSLGRK